MKCRLLIAALAFWMIGAWECQADSPWRVLWVPWLDTYSSWNWTEAPGSAVYQPVVAAGFPTDVKIWELAVCSRANPQKQARAAMKNPFIPNSPMKLGISYTDWGPGNFPVDPLEALGDGDFLCAILGDGKRYSNVSRVTIHHGRHGFHYDTRPIIRLKALTYPEHDIRWYALWVIPGPDQDIHLYDVIHAYLCVNGTWAELGPWPILAADERLPSGRGFGEIGGIGDRQPPLKPLLSAEMQVKIISDWVEQTKGLPPLNPNQDLAQQVKDRVQSLKGYLSNTVAVTYSDQDERDFDAAFSLK
jgi:hypothetical protein